MRPQPNNTRLARFVERLMDRVPLVSRGEHRKLQDRLYKLRVDYEDVCVLADRHRKLSETLAEKRAYPISEVARDRSDPYLEIEPSVDMNGVRTMRVVIPRLEVCFSEYVGWRPVGDSDEETRLAIRQLARRICAAHADHMEEHVLRRILAQ